MKYDEYNMSCGEPIHHTNDIDTHILPANSKSVCLMTLGCKLNQCESEQLRQQFEHHGYQAIEDPSQADIVFVSTCAVTNRAEQKSRQAIRHAGRLNPHAKIVAAGCAVQRNPDTYAKLPNVSLILGSQDRQSPFPLLKNGTKRAVSDIDANTVIIAGGAPQNRSRALLKIQDGCNIACTYCVVPQARGPSRSVPPEEVLTRAWKLVESGYHEIILSGVHIGDYRGGTNHWNLCRLLDEFDVLPSDVRIRLSSLEPWAITPELFEKVTHSNRICPHFHIPFQSGSSSVLQRMGRPYTRPDLIQLLDVIASYPGVGLGGDVIAGFPRETESEFQDTVDLIKSHPFSYLHVFPFSRRPGTIAYSFPDQISSRVITQRAKQLRKLGEQKKTQFLTGLLGTDQQVIFERTQHNGYRYGVSANYAKVQVKNSDLKPKEIYTIRVVDIDKRPVIGEFPIPD